MKRASKNKFKKAARGRREWQADNENGDPPECSVHLPDMSDLPSAVTDQCPSQSDVLLLTVKDCEFLSCYAYLQNPLKHYVNGLGYVYFGIIGDEEHEHMKVGLMKCSEGSVGPGSSLVTVKDAITSLQPKALISVGYCSGLNREKAKLGDVVVCAKLTTYASKMVLDTKEQSIRTRTVVSRNFLNLVKNVADGWKAPLKNLERREVEVHAGGEFLSGPEGINLDWRHAELFEAHPQAYAMELEGKELLTAAYDLRIEWLVVKAIADFADGTDIRSSWKGFASAMAASVVFHLLSDPSVFKDWPHYKENIRSGFETLKTDHGKLSDKLESLKEGQGKLMDQGSCEFEMVKRKLDDWTSGPPPSRRPKMEDGYDPTEMIENIRQLYKTREGAMNLLPWCEDLNFSFGNFYTRLKVIYKDKTRGTATDRVLTMSEIFNPHEECEEPRVVSIEGKPGMGKTTCCKKVVFDWATQKHATGNYFTKFLIVLLIKCREVQYGLWEAIDDQLLPQDVGDHQRKRFFDFIRHNESKVLLVLDGLSEVSKRKLPTFLEIIQGRVLPKCRVAVTARHEAGVIVRQYCDTLLEVEGFTEEDVKTFIVKYFRENMYLAAQLIERLDDDESLYEMSTNPLNVTLLCVIYEDLNGVFPENRSKLYMEIVDCILRRYRAKKQLPENGEDLVQLYESQLKHLGSIALKGLLEDNLDFDEKELGKHKESDLPGFGFLSVQPGGSKLRPTIRYSFLHKTFQEFFAALDLAYQLMEKEIRTKSIAVDKRYRHELKKVLLFAFGILAARCQETAKNLIKSMATQLNQEDEDNEPAYSMTVLLKCIDECKNEKNFDAELARALGHCLQIKAMTGSRRAKASLIANILITNTSVTKLDLSCNEGGDDEAAVLAECLKENKSLTELCFSRNEIGYYGAAALAECLKENVSLAKLNLNHNNIGDVGAAALAECLKENASLTELYLEENKIGDSGAAALAECLKVNTSLKKLKLPFNKIGDAGAVALAESLKVNHSLQKLNLSKNEIGGAGAAALAETLEDNTSLTALNVSYNGIGDAGVDALAKRLEDFTSVTERNVFHQENR
ncbi:nucleotide-binding oligomerization domain-containing protein 2-like [Stylophora pistillata]|nr:nucleotide-binding oligomerization domain-containing protein 2-like [Stylophora pistillata]XP_022808218.1 nucleotide-binding oligomerization domain-containing protein 2-like [Stylophora pistillata]XP_022808219.1 nucleotide-binding oligomerization domain-containing protein 2-like [Stylophora pistillata]XP_022808220.1 nucleotide-binding oligomerization domain-containing protein 2-like [Stylophora pistillata]XP_022808221.1 nucleotide-binding oligomerization domain-containing protein 2-like [Sty